MLFILNNNNSQEASYVGLSISLRFLSPLLWPPAAIPTPTPIATASPSAVTTESTHPLATMGYVLYSVSFAFLVLATGMSPHATLSSLHTNDHQPFGSPAPAGCLESPTSTRACRPPSLAILKPASAPPRSTSPETSSPATAVPAWTSGASARFRRSCKVARSTSTRQDASTRSSDLRRTISDRMVGQGIQSL